jgi:hypothetical protein
VRNGGWCGVEFRPGNERWEHGPSMLRLRSVVRFSSSGELSAGASTRKGNIKVATP